MPNINHNFGKSFRFRDYFHGRGRDLDQTDAATDETVYCSFRLPDDYSSGATLTFQWSDSGGTAPGASVDAVRWACEVMAITPNSDTAAADSDSYDTANEVDDEADNTNAKALMEADLTLANFDSAAAGDRIWLKIYRNADHANDTLANDAWLWGLVFSYTAA